MTTHLDRLKQRLADTHNLDRAGSVLVWDQRTYMPVGGAAARAEQIATLSRLHHELFTSDETGAMLEQAGKETIDLPADSQDAALVRVALRDFNRERKIPVDLVTESRRHATLANQAWIAARAGNQFTQFVPYLERTIDLSRQRAEYLGYDGSPYDALLDEYEPGMRTADVRRIFTQLRDELVPLVRAIADHSDRADDRVLHQPFDEVQQEAFGRMVAERFGYDFARGRQDRTVHPFETTFSRNDVRITTRFETDFLSPALFGTMHETGHALYEQGVGENLEGTLLARGASMGMHESQSRMWENVVGRSRPFWGHFYPLLQQTFPSQLYAVDVDSFYRAINRVKPSFIRVEADEVTYNLHIMLRFEMEVDMLEGRLPAAEAAEVWNSKMEDYLGIRPPTDTVGVLQDIHWSEGLVGYFPTYALGNILSLQLYDSAVRDVPAIPDAVASGEFAPLRDWLTDRIYRYGRTYEPSELLERATGERLQSNSYVTYLKRKFGEIYGLA